MELILNEDSGMYGFDMEVIVYIKVIYYLYMSYSLCYIIFIFGLYMVYIIRFGKGNYLYNL